MLHFWQGSECASPHEYGFVVITVIAWKVSKYGYFSGPYFPVFRLNTGNYGPQKTPYLDTFHALNRKVIGLLMLGDTICGFEIKWNIFKWLIYYLQPLLPHFDNLFHFWKQFWRVINLVHRPAVHTIMDLTEINSGQGLNLY